MRRVNVELVTVYNAKREMWSDVHEEYHTVTVSIICLYKRKYFGDHYGVRVESLYLYIYMYVRIMRVCMCQANCFLIDKVISLEYSLAVSITLLSL